MTIQGSDARRRFPRAGHTSGSGAVWGTAFCAAAANVCALHVPKLAALNVPPKKARRFIMSDLPAHLCELAKASAKNFAIPQLLAMD